MLGLAALPTIYKVAGVLGILLLLTIGAGVLYAKGRSDQATIDKGVNARAIAEQIARDQATSAEEIKKRDARIAEVEASKSTITKVIQNAPVTNGCGSAVGAALDWLQQRSGSGTPAR